MKIKIKDAGDDFDPEQDLQDDPGWLGIALVATCFILGWLWATAERAFGRVKYFVLTGRRKRG